MISEIRIQNFKSIQDLTLKPGRVTVLIGANGSGKSNILEGIAFAAGAAVGNLDPALLVSRGVRVTDAPWMQSAFPDAETEGRTTALKPICLSIDDAEDDAAEEPMLECRVRPRLHHEDQSFTGWRVYNRVKHSEVDAVLRNAEFFREFAKSIKTPGDDIELEEDILGSPEDPIGVEEVKRRRMRVRIQLNRSKKRHFARRATAVHLVDYLIYSPENSILRGGASEGAALPLGARGEGLLALLQSFADQKINPKLTARFDEMKERLRLFGWFEDMLAPDEAAPAEASMQLRDRWLAEDRAVFDQRSANEGFLYVLFYFTLLMSWRTPKFFAIDNLDNALNPKLCAVLMKQIIELARTYGKQVICTTHNPAVLEGLDLTQDDQRLFVVRRDVEGHTAVRRVHAPQPQPGEEPVSLSEAFMRGLIGGLPNNF